MKKGILIVFVTIFLVSCGPKRLKCGPRGICKIYPVKTEKLSNENSHLETPKSKVVKS